MNESKHKLTDADFAWQVGHDHGVVPAILAGLTATDLESQDTELARHWAYLEQELARLQPNINRVQLLLDRAIKEGR